MFEVVSMLHRFFVFRPWKSVKRRSIRRFFFMDMWAFPRIGVPQNGWFINGKPYEQMDDLGVPLFLETPMS